MSNELVNGEPIDFIFVYSSRTAIEESVTKNKYKIDVLEGKTPKVIQPSVYNVHATCRHISPVKCDILIWAIYNSGNRGDKVGGHIYHEIKTNILSELNRNRKFRALVERTIRIEIENRRQ